MGMSLITTWSLFPSGEYQRSGVRSPGGAALDGISGVQISLSIKQEAVVWE